MNKYEEFIKFVDELVSVFPPEDLPDSFSSVRAEILTLGQNFKERPLFTESGIQILEYLQSHETKNMKAKDIADGMMISSRKVSGAVRKLVTDGFVDKFGQNPVIYSLTEKGKNFDINDYKEKMNNEENND